MSRLQKYNSKKKKKLVLVSKLVIAFYLVIFSFSYLTGGTIAYFGNSSQSTVNLKAGTWFDGSELAFIDKGTQVEKSCSAVEISAEFKNEGNKMQGTAKYEIYSTVPQGKGNGAPDKHGSLQFEGVIPALEKNEEITLTYEAEQEGDYVFKVYQREGYDGDEQEIWSNKFKIQCNEEKGNNKQDAEDKEQETVTSEEDVDEGSQPKEQVNEEKEVVEETTDETTDEPVESEPSQQDPTEDKNNQSNEQDESSTEDVPEEQDNAEEETSEEETNNTNKQPVGEGESNEETD